MTKHSADQTPQLGFDELLVEAELENRNRIFERETAHLPGCMEEALPYFRGLIERHHAAMLSADVEQTMELRKQAHLLAKKLNNGDPGILAHDNSPGCFLEHETKAPDGEMPLWGQTGNFEITASGMQVRIEIEGLFGIGASHLHCLGFSARAVKLDKPFLSETGYRSFLGVSAKPRIGLMPEMSTRHVIESYVETELSGKLLRISDRYRTDHNAG